MAAEALNLRHLFSQPTDSVDLHPALNSARLHEQSLVPLIAGSDR